MQNYTILQKTLDSNLSELPATKPPWYIMFFSKHAGCSNVCIICPIIIGCEFRSNYDYLTSFIY